MKSVKTFAKSLKIWSNSLKTRAKVAKRALICKTWRSTFAKSHQDLFPFFGGHPEKGLHEKIFARKVAKNFFGQVWGNSGKNPSHPQKFTCSYTYGYRNDSVREASTTIIPQIEICNKLLYLLLCNKFCDSFAYFPLSILNLVNPLFHASFCWKWPESCHVFVRWPVGSGDSRVKEVGGHCRAKLKVGGPT